MFNNKELLLMELLKCGSMDIEFLEEVMENTNIELEDVIEDVESIGNEIDFNSILYSYLSLKFSTALNNIEEIMNVSKKNLQLAKSKIEDVVEISINGLATYISFSNDININIYPRDTDEEMEEEISNYIYNIYENNE